MERYTQFTLTIFEKVLPLITWPVIALTGLLLFAPDIKDLASRLEGPFKAPGGVEAHLKSKEATSFIAAAETRQQILAVVRSKVSEKLYEEIVNAAPDTGSAAKAAIASVETIKPADLNKAERILWVDDHPSNNTNEKAALEKLGFQITTALNTEQALSAMATQTFQLVISDMTRGGDSEAGRDLLSKLKARGNAPPVVFYSGSAKPVPDAFGVTSNPSELIRLVARVAKQGREVAAPALLR